MYASQKYVRRSRRLSSLKKFPQKLAKNPERARKSHVQSLKAVPAILSDVLAVLWAKPKASANDTHNAGAERLLRHPAVATSTAAAIPEHERLAAKLLRNALRSRRHDHGRAGAATPQDKALGSLGSRFLRDITTYRAKGAASG